mmetsp:Transcript_22792/g.39006  ORF Transcript_22792/g.39006 Transcript_22792/m.39006 type:complete len:82 (-) Transcript_22792:89-334(-)
MCPTAPTVLWNMLIPHTRQIRISIHILPREILGQRRLCQVSVWERIDYVVKGRWIGDRMILGFNYGRKGEDADDEKCARNG